MEIRLADKSNFNRDSLRDFRRYQEVKNVYRLHDGQLTLVSNPFTEDWDPQRRLEKAEEICSGRFITYCAFEGERVVGEIMLRPLLHKGRLIIDSFHVSEEYRRQGIGTALWEAAKKEAFRRGARALYASCCSAEETIRFYTAVGFRLSDDPIASCVEEEPFDIQMECPISHVTIRPERNSDYKSIVSLVLRSFREGTDYSDGTDIVALIEEIRDSAYHIPALSFVAELEGEIVGHFLFSRFPLSETPEGGHGGADDTDIVMLAPVSVHADRLRQGIGSAMLALGIEEVKKLGFRGIIVEGNYHFYNTVGFRTSSEYGIYPVSGFPMVEPRCQMCMETFPGSLQGKGGYVVYDMYYNA